MSPEQEPKYNAVVRLSQADLLRLLNQLDESPDDHVIVEAYLENRASGERIPDDEPVFVFRARDCIATFGLAGYQKRLIEAGAEPTHRESVSRRMLQFAVFARDHPERLKMPDTDESLMLAVKRD